VSPAALRALADIAAALARLASAAAEEPASDPDALLPLAAAASLACTTPRALRDAARRGELVLRGAQRSRCVRRIDVVAWAESRTRPVAGVDDGDIARRVAQLEAARRKRRPGPSHKKGRPTP
jgi:hypothetical protein